MLEHIARHKGYIPIPEPPEGDIGTANGYNASGPPRGRAVARAGAGRLRDAIVFGYMMQRHRARGKVCNVFTCKKTKEKKRKKRKSKGERETESETGTKDKDYSMPKSHRHFWDARRLSTDWSMTNRTT
jgi:hypothetical protein